MSAVSHLSTSSIRLAVTQSSRVHDDVWCETVQVQSPWWCALQSPRRGMIRLKDNYMSTRHHAATIDVHLVAVYLHWLLVYYTWPTYHISSSRHYVVSHLVISAIYTNPWALLSPPPGCTSRSLLFQWQDATIIFITPCQPDVLIVVIQQRSRSLNQDAASNKHDLGNSPGNSRSHVTRHPINRN